MKFLNIERPGKSFAHFPAVLGQEYVPDIAHCRKIGYNAFGKWINIFFEAYASGIAAGHSHI